MQSKRRGGTAAKRARVIGSNSSGKTTETSPREPTHVHLSGCTATVDESFQHLKGGFGQGEEDTTVMKRTVVTSDLVNREIGYLVSEEGVQEGDVFHDFGHEHVDVLVIFVVRARNEFLFVNMSCL